MVQRCLLSLLIWTLCAQPVVMAHANAGDGPPAYARFLNESLEYDLSFMWFERLAVGTMEFLPTDLPDQFLLRMEARTRGLAALFTRNRIEKFETLVDINSDGRLRPLLHSSHRITGSGDSISERIARYTFDYEEGTILYQRIRNGKISDDQWFDLDPHHPVFDILSALYNFRLGFFGWPDSGPVLIPTFHHRGEQDILVELFVDPSSRDKQFFSSDMSVYRVLMDPVVFNTHSRDVFISFDQEMRLDKGIIKRLVGLGDLRGELRRP